MQELGISAVALSINSESTELLESFCKTVARHLTFKTKKYLIIENMYLISIELEKGVFKVWGN